MKNRKAFPSRPTRGGALVFSGIILFALAACVTWSAVHYYVREATNNDPQPLFSNVTWQSHYVLGISVVLLCVGLFFLLAAIVPGRTMRLPLKNDNTDTAVEASVEIAALVAYIQQRCARIDGVEKTRVKVSPRKIRISITPITPYEDELYDRVEERMRSLVETFALKKVPKLNVHISGKKRK